mmetsp:Transcript_5359/g.9531  ORF Transcript_5359/g.9531 Transcript_5359/m.9531 type:complete len:315 (-) Transcript_5359:1181-2125(-)
MPNINTAQPSPTSEEDSAYGSPSQTPIQDNHPNTTTTTAAQRQTAHQVNPYSGQTDKELLETLTQWCRDKLYNDASNDTQTMDYFGVDDHDPLKTPLADLLSIHSFSLAFLNQDPHLSFLLGAGTWNNNFVALSLPPEEEGLYLSVVLIPMTTPLLRTVREASKTAIRNNRSAPFTKPSTATRAGTQHPCIAPCPTSWVKEFLKKTTMPPHRALAICLDQPVQPLHQPHKDFHSTWFRAGATHMQDESGKPFPTYSALYTPATLLPLKELATTHPPLYRLIHDDLLASWGKTATDLLQQLSASAASTHVHPTVY